MQWLVLEYAILFDQNIGIFLKIYLHSKLIAYFIKKNYNLKYLHEKN